MNSSLLTHPGLGITLNFAEDFASLCQPIINKFGLNCVRHVRLYNDMSQFTLCTRPDTMEWYYGNQLYQYGYSARHPSTYTEGYVLSDSWEKEGPAYELLGKPFEEDFNVAHSLCYHLPTADYCDIFEFGAGKEHAHVYLDLLSNLDTLVGFIKAEMLSNQMIQMAQSKTFVALSPDNQLAYENKHRNKIIEINAVNQGLNTLARREVQTLYWMQAGKTIPEISLILGLSPRTIEMYVRNLKMKLNIRTAFQMGQLVGRYQSHFKALFSTVVGSK